MKDRKPLKSDRENSGKKFYCQGKQQKILKD
jgi:hypothetical protein